MINVIVNPECTEAKLEIVPEPENFEEITADQLVAILKKKGVIAGISKKNLFAVRDKFNNDHSQPATTIIAKGIPPKPVLQHQYQFHFSTGKNIGQVKGSDQIDYKSKGVIKYFQPGDVLLEITLGQEGVPGRLVNGNVTKNIPLTPLRKYKAGPGVSLTEKNKTITYSATTPGQPLLRNNQLEISGTYQLKGDVDLETGHIKFAGPIEISGSLLADFKIISNADITIGKTVSGSIKTKGNLTAKGGIIGSETEKIIVGGELICEYISTARHIQTGGAITVSKHIINSHILSNKTVSCQESITGESKISAFYGVTCAELGSDQGSETSIEIGDATELHERLKKIEEFLEPLTTESIAIVDQLGMPVLMKKDTSSLPEEKRPEADKLLQKYLAIEENANRLKAKKSELEAKAEAGLQARVTVKDCAHPGTTIKIGLESYTIDRTVSGPVEFYFDHDKKTITFERLMAS